MLAILSLVTGGVSSILGFALKHWRLALAIITALAIALVILTLTHERDAARQRVAADAQTIATQKTQIAALQSNVATLTTEIGKQNAAVVSLGLESAQRQKAASEAMATAVKASAVAQKQITALNAKNAAPAAIGRSCEDALAEWRAGR